jgi:AcrR family transcriptional regulator
VAATPEPPNEVGSWREQAVARSLDPARARAEHRVQRFLDAALDLMSTRPDREFTVQEVVERSGQSLRSFYQHFAGKHELLLALFEESVRSTAEQLRASIADEEDPLERVRIVVIGYYRRCRPKARGDATVPPAPALAEFAQQLLTSQPEAAAQAFGPLVALVEEVLAGASAAGAIRPGLRLRRVAGVILQAIMFNAFAATISGPPSRPGGRDAAEELCEMLLHGIGSAAAT